MECAGHSAVSDLVPEVLDAGIDVVVASVGALGDRGLRESLEHRASSAGALLQLVPGAVGGLDALRGAMLAGVDSVIYEGRKPPGHGRTQPRNVCAASRASPRR
ncbi:hypothetical protein [Nesterenkonia pannonica]|uniref:hypothetical protein n=1 Tax=Nesterenkonia pannonica TaxID=1548602 RepID=UPI00216461FC|nr:hypothetical protein [Nesterenkonia pannonica]